MDEFELSFEIVSIPNMFLAHGNAPMTKKGTSKLVVLVFNLNLCIYGV